MNRYDVTYSIYVRVVSKVRGNNKDEAKSIFKDMIEKDIGFDSNVLGICKIKEQSYVIISVNEEKK